MGRNKGRKKGSSSPAQLTSATTTASKGSSSSLPSSAATTACTVATSTSCACHPEASPIPPEVKESVDAEITNSLREFDLGNNDKAMRLMDKACLIHPSFPVPYMMRSYLYNTIADSTKITAEKLRLVRIAADSATQASSHSSFNAFFRAHEVLVLYEIAIFFKDAKLYDEIIEKCDFALSLHTADLIDPLTEFGNDEKLRNLVTAESRIEHSLQILRSVRDNTICSKARLGDFPVVPAPLSISGAKGKLPSSSSSRTRQRGNFQQAQQTAVFDQPKTKVLDYLLSLTVKNRLDLRLYSVSVLDLMESAKGQQLDALSSEALDVAAVGRPMKAFPCCYCHVIPFALAEKLMAHILEEHVGNLQQRLKDLMPQIDNCDMEKILPQKASYRSIQSIKDCSPLDDHLLQRSPSSDAASAERVELLNKIGRVFRMMEDQKILSDRQLQFVIHWSKTCLGRSANQLLDRVTDPIECIRFLLAPQLKMILKFLEALWKACGVNENKKEESSTDSNADWGPQESPWLFLDHNWLILDIDEENPNALIDWLYDHSTDGDDPKEVWRRTLTECRQMIEKLQIEFSFFCLVCKEKQRSIDAWTNLVNLSLVKNVGPEHLKKRKEELVDGSNNVELLAINEMMESADPQKDRIMITKKASQIYIQTCLIEARILSSQRRLDQLEQKIGQVSAYNYKKVLMQLVKSFLQKRLEDKIINDAIGKSDAAMKELLDEETASQQNNKGGNHSKKGNVKASGYNRGT